MSVFVEVFERSRNDRVVVVQILIGTVEEIQEMKIMIVKPQVGKMHLPESFFGQIVSAGAVRDCRQIFGTAAGLLSVIGFLPDVFIHTWYGSMIDAQGTAAFNGIFGIEIGLAVVGIFCLVMLLRSIKKHRNDIIEEEVESEIEADVQAQEA